MVMREGKGMGKKRPSLLILPVMMLLCIYGPLVNFPPNAEASYESPQMEVDESIQVWT
ncbi:MAG: hypothetical protein QXH42_02570 [Thermoplasmata archaeon]